MRKPWKAISAMRHMDRQTHAAGDAPSKASAKVIRKSSIMRVMTVSDGTRGVQLGELEVCASIRAKAGVAQTPEDKFRGGAGSARRTPHPATTSGQFWLSTIYLAMRIARIQATGPEVPRIPCHSAWDCIEHLHNSLPAGSATQPPAALPQAYPIPSSPAHYQATACAPEPYSSPMTREPEPAAISSDRHIELSIIDQLELALYRTGKLHSYDRASIRQAVAACIVARAETPPGPPGAATPSPDTAQCLPVEYSALTVAVPPARPLDESFTASPATRTAASPALTPRRLVTIPIRQLDLSSTVRPAQSEPVPAPPHTSSQASSSSQPPRQPSSHTRYAPHRAHYRHVARPQPSAAATMTLRAADLLAYMASTSPDSPRVPAEKAAHRVL